MDLIEACEGGDTKKALSLIMNIKQHIIFDDVLLMPLIFELDKVQLKMNNDTNLSIVDSYGKTALIYACKNKMKEVALKLIQTGHAKPEQVYNDDCTVLICACQNKMEEVALELIKTGYAKPEQVVSNGCTALIWACQKGMTKVALELIQTGHAKPEQVDNLGYTALILACSNKMKEVVLELNWICQL